MNFSRKRVVVWVMSAVILAGWTSAVGQLKIRYINSQKILEQYPEFQEAQRELEQLRSNYEKEFTDMQTRAQKLYDEIQNQSLLLSPEKKQEKEVELQKLMSDLDRYQYEKLGPQGELYRKNKELTDPIVDKITQVIQKIGQDEGYDFILDAVQGLVLHAKQEYDITDQVLEELSKTQ